MIAGVCMACMYLESLAVDADRAAWQRADVLALIHAELGCRYRSSVVTLVNFLNALPCIDGHADQANTVGDGDRRSAAGVRSAPAC